MTLTPNKDDQSNEDDQSKKYYQSKKDGQAVSSPIKSGRLPLPVADKWRPSKAGRQGTAH